MIPERIGSQASIWVESYDSERTVVLDAFVDALDRSFSQSWIGADVRVSRRTDGKNAK